MNVGSTLVGTKSEQEAGEVPGFGAQLLESITARASAYERAERASAFARYSAAPLPHSKMEEWRRTDPARFPFAAMRRAAPAVAGTCRAHPWDKDFDLVVAIEGSRFQVLDTAGWIGRGDVIVWPLAEAWARGLAGEAGLREWGERPDPADRFALIAEPFWNVGFYVEVKDGVRLDRGLLFRYYHVEDRGLVVSRIVIQAGEGSRVEAVECFDGPRDGENMSVVSRRWLIGSRAHVRWTTLRDEGPRTIHLADEWAALRHDAKLDWVTLNLGGRLIKTRFTADAVAPGAAVEADGIFFAHGEQHVDQKTLQVHSSPDTVSRLLYKGAVKDRAYSVYQGQIIAKPGAVRVDAYQKNNNLVLNDGARADSMPGLQIDADDLKCSHGSTIGNLDEEQLFYLRSRGLDRRTARATLIRGFFEEVAQRISYEHVRERLQQRVEERLE